MRTISAFGAVAVLALIALPLGGCEGSKAPEPPPPDETMTEDKVQPAFSEEEAKAAEEAAQNQ